MGRITLERKPGESDAALEKRETKAYKTNYWHTVEKPRLDNQSPDTKRKRLDHRNKIRNEREAAKSPRTKQQQRERRNRIRPTRAGKPRYAPGGVGEQRAKERRENASKRARTSGNSAGPSLSDSTAQVNNNASVRKSGRNRKDVNYAEKDDSFEDEDDVDVTELSEAPEAVPTIENAGPPLSDRTARVNNAAVRNRKDVNYTEEDERSEEEDDVDDTIENAGVSTNETIADDNTGMDFDTDNISVAEMDTDGNQDKYGNQNEDGDVQNEDVQNETSHSEGEDSEDLQCYHYDDHDSEVAQTTTSTNPDAEFFDLIQCRYNEKLGNREWIPIREWRPLADEIIEELRELGSLENHSDTDALRRIIFRAIPKIESTNSDRRRKTDTFGNNEDRVNNTASVCKSRRKRSVPPLSDYTARVNHTASVPKISRKRSGPPLSDATAQVSNTASVRKSSRKRSTNEKKAPEFLVGKLLKITEPNGEVAKGRLTRYDEWDDISKMKGVRSEVTDLTQSETETDEILVDSCASDFLSIDRELVRDRDARDYMATDELSDISDSGFEDDNLPQDCGKRGSGSR